MNKIFPHKSKSADFILISNFVLITVLYALLMFTDEVPLPGLILLGVLWLAFGIITRRISFATPMDLPIIGLVGLLPLSFAISIDRNLTLPKIYGLVLSIPVFYVIVNFIRRRSRLQLAATAVIFLSFATAMLGLLGTDWNESKFTFLSQFYQFFPNFIKAIPGAPVGQGINANTLGGALTFFLPFLISLLWDKGGFKRMLDKNSQRVSLKNILYKVGILFALLLASITLLLSQSRGAYIGCAFGLFVLAIWKDQRFLWLIPLIALFIIIAQQDFESGSLLDLISQLDTSGEATLLNRLDLWRNTIYLIQDFPVTGIGLSTFGPVFVNFYTFNIFQYGDLVFFHAHNNLLNVAVEMGLPALVLYCTMLGGFFTMAWHTYRTGRAFIRALTIGLACGMLAHQVFGLMDAYTLGKKFGVIMWIYFGLITALYIHRHRLNRKSKHLKTTLQIHRKPTKDQVLLHLRNLLIGVGFWLLISSASLAFINNNAILSLAIAVVGGILLGVVLVWRYREVTSRNLPDRVAEIEEHSPAF